MEKILIVRVFFHSLLLLMMIGRSRKDEEKASVLKGDYF